MTSRARLARLEARRGRQAPSFDIDYFFACLFAAPDRPTPARRRDQPPRCVTAEEFYAQLFAEARQLAAPRGRADVDG